MVFCSVKKQLCFFETFSSFQTSLRASHKDLGSDFILWSTDKAFLEEGISHSLHPEGQMLKGSDEVFNCA
jgi:hypothetical protein